MRLAAIDIGTNSIHMIVVEVVSQRNFAVIEREKQMVKLGAGVFANGRLSTRAFATGLDVIERYAQLADDLGADEVMMVATSAIREAQNGEDFLAQVARRSGLAPRIISGKEEARLILLAVRNSIALEDRSALVFDIGGGSTEAVIGDRQALRFSESLPLGVLRLLDMVASGGPMGSESRHLLEAHLRFVAQEAISRIEAIGFTQVIGTSGTIRALGEAAHRNAGGRSLQSLNAEIVQLDDLRGLTDQLLQSEPKERSGFTGISDQRSEAIHLGAVLLVQLLEMVGATQITLCEASLREGMILDYLEQHPLRTSPLPQPASLRLRKVAQLARKYESDLPRNEHVAHLALQLFDQTRALHRCGEPERELLQLAALLHDIGKFISFRKHHKNSRDIISRTMPRGFTDRETALIAHLTRYHCKAAPTKRHKRFRKLPKRDRTSLCVLAGMLRIAVALDRARSQRVASLCCQISDRTILILLAGRGPLDLEIRAAQATTPVLASALERTLSVHPLPGGA